MASKKHNPSAGKGMPTLPATAGLGFYLREAYRAFSRDFHARLARHGITHAQWVMLWFLSQAGSLTPLELSRRAGIQKASATSVIDALKKRRLIRGDRDGVDRRKINLHLTPTGLDLTQELFACAAEANADARLGFSDKELETLLRLLRGVTANLESKSSGSASA
jgi:DNA-binding MarR family transcriptional regulator